MNPNPPMKRLIYSAIATLLALPTILFAQQKQMVVVQPNGGETLIAGSTYTLHWESTPSNLPVDLMYSIDGGSSWRTIVTGVNGSTYQWTVPFSPSQECFLRVQEQRSAQRLELRGHDHRINAGKFSNSGTLAVTAGDDDVALLWNVATGTHLRT